MRKVVDQHVFMLYRTHPCHPLTQQINALLLRGRKGGEKSRRDQRSLDELLTTNYTTKKLDVCAAQ